MFGDLLNAARRAIGLPGQVSTDNRYQNNAQAGDKSLNGVANQYRASGDFVPGTPDNRPAAAPAPAAGFSGAGGGAAYNPNTDPGAIAARRGEIGGLRPQLDSLYNQIFAGIDNVAREKSGTINNQAGQQRDSMQKQYLGDQNQIGANFTGRGTYDSSYRPMYHDQ